jgi:hypothetical protein
MLEDFFQVVGSSSYLCIDMEHKELLQMDLHRILALVKEYCSFQDHVELEHYNTLSQEPKCGGDPFATTLYAPYQYKGSCLNPPLERSLQACPIAEAERKVLSDGKTKAIPYPAKGFNCNPYGIGLNEKKKGLS